MAVQCANCGEPLLGSVNRCWKCGREFVSRTGAAEIPPVRRRPIPESLEGPLEAIVVEDVATPAGAGSQQGERWHRTGSPFARAGEEDDGVIEGAQFATDRPRATQYPQAPGAKGGSVAAIVLACISLVVLFLFPLGGLILTLVGLGLGTWGLRAPRRRAAIAGLILCCLAFTLSAAWLTVEVYTYLYP